MSACPSGGAPSASHRTVAAWTAWAIGACASEPPAQVDAGLLRDGSAAHRDSGSAVVDASPASIDAGEPAIETDNPTIPTLFDAYRFWDRWPQLRLGTRVYMRSTYDRSGGNEAADASHFLRVTDVRAVALDVAGSGALLFERFNHWHGSPWHFVVDGTDNAVQETDTATPNSPTANSIFLPAAPFPRPLGLTWSTTQGADLIAAPIPFQHSVEIDYERTHYGTGYTIYQLFPQGARNLSQPMASWSASWSASPPPDVVDLLARAGEDIAPTTPDVHVQSGTLAIPAAGAVTVFDASGPASVRALKLTVPVGDAPALGAASLRVSWDDRGSPSIDAPISLFFGTGSLYNRSASEFLVKALPVNVRFAGGSVTFAAYFPMPFRRHAHVEIVGGGTAVTAVGWQARLQPYTGPGNWVGYLHATYADHGQPNAGKDLTLLDTTAVEGGGDWCGHFVGTSFVFSDRANLTTLEGDPRFFFDDSQTPQVQGTGTEEWGGGGDYWGGQTTTLPLLGHPVGAPDSKSAQTPDDQIESAYRFLLADLMPFGKNARIQFEHGGLDDSTEHYRTVAYWYGLPGACLVQTDALHVGDPADEAAHRYLSPAASTVDTLSTRYEWGVDHVGSTVVYSATDDTGRHTTGTSEFSVAIRADNFGVLLRRKLDYGVPDQRAEVYVADDAQPGATFAHAGTWYLAGSNTCAFSNPPSELSPIAASVEVSNRRWRDDEFLIGRALTKGRKAIRIRVVFSPTSTPVVPGASPAPSAWSEFRYTAYAWVLPPMP